MFFFLCAAQLGFGANSAMIATHHAKVAGHSKFSALSLLASRFGSKGRGRHRDASSGREDVQGSPDIATAVSALQKLQSQFEKEAQATSEQSKGQKKNCSAELNEWSPLNKAIREGQQLITESKDTLFLVNDEIKALDWTISCMEERITEAKETAGNLTKQLKDLRDGETSSEEESKQVLQQFDAVVNRDAWAEQREPQKRHREDHSRLNHEVSNLQRLGRQLSGLSSRRERGHEAALEFLQTSAAKTEPGHAHSGTVLALEADRQRLARVHASVDKGFTEEVNELIGLIEGARGKLKALQVDRDQHHLVWTDKIRQQAEATRARDQAERVLERDQKVLQFTEEACKVETGGTIGQISIGLGQVVNLIKMAEKLLYSMDAASFLSRDLQALGQAPSFVQLQAQAKAQTDATATFRVAAKAQRVSLGEAVKEALQDAASTSEAGETAEELDSASSLSDPVGRIAAHAALLQSSTGSGTGERAAGPFDTVVKMIHSLIANLNDQGNEDTNLHQWCLESKQENDEAVLSNKRELDLATSQILWATAATEKLEDEKVFFAAEISRLEALAKDARGGRKSQSETWKTTLAAHDYAREVFGEIVDLLKGECDIGEQDLEATDPEAGAWGFSETMPTNEGPGVGGDCHAVASIAECKELCLSTTGCVAFAYSDSEGKACLKGALSTAYDFSHSGSTGYSFYFKTEAPGLLPTTTTSQPTTQPTTQAPTPPPTPPTTQAPTAPATPYCYKMITGSEAHNDGTLSARVKVGTAVGAVASGSMYSKGDTVSSNCFADPIAWVKVLNPTNNAWLGAAEYSTDGGATFSGMVCSANCNIVGPAGLIAVDGNGDGANGAPVTCMNGQECTLTPQEAAASASFLQLGQTGDHSSRHSAAYLRTRDGQCAEAAKMVVDARRVVGEVDQAIRKYDAESTTIVMGEEKAAQEAADQRILDLRNTQTAKADRNQEVQLAMAMKRRKEDRAVQLQEASKAIDQKCIVRDTSADRQSRMTDEIEALKNAYAVLNGEAIPVDTALLSVASSPH